MSLGHSIDELQAIGQKIGATSVDDVLKFLGGGNFATRAQFDVIDMLGGAKGIADMHAKGGLAKQAARFAGSGAFRNAARLVPGISAGFAALDAADIVAGNEGLGNKIADLGAGLVGGGIGLVAGGPVGALAGFSGGKLLMDGMQAMLGMDRAAENQRLAKSYQMMNGGGQF